MGGCVMNQNHIERLHFFTNEHKRLEITNLKELFGEYDKPHTWEHVVVYHGYIQLGVIVGLCHSFIGISQYGLCTFADTKSEIKGFWIQSHIFDDMITSGTSLDNLLREAKDDIECQIASNVNTYDKHGYRGVKVNECIPFHHPEFTLQEMVEARKAENRVIFWRPKA